MYFTPFLRLLCISGSELGRDRIFPNISKNEKLETEQLTIHKIKKWIHESENTSKKELEILSPSTMPAYSIAALIKNNIAHPKKIIIEKQLDVMEKRNSDYCAKILKRHYEEHCANYSDDSAFDDAQLFETRSELRIRWYRFLSDFITQAEAKNVSLNNILVSFPEVFYPLTRELFGGELTQRIEAFELSVFKHGDTEVVLHGRFREKTKSAYYNIEGLSLIGNS